MDTGSMKTCFGLNATYMAASINSSVSGIIMTVTVTDSPGFKRAKNCGLASPPSSRRMTISGLLVKISNIVKLLYFAVFLISNVSLCTINCYI